MTNSANNKAKFALCRTVQGIWSKILRFIKSPRPFHVAKAAVLSLQYLFPALLVGALGIIVYRVGGLYPFGKKSLSWCDMDTQIVPLLCNLKDVLQGKASLFLSFENGGGMNFLGVFFYYLSSPFHLLVIFADKAEMMQFVNVLVLLKLMAAATSAYVYFRNTLPAVSPVLALALSLFYAFCGYGAIYFQILLWLDMLYLFPLLLLGVEHLIKRRKPYLYLIALTASFIICFYLSYMCVLLLILFVGAHLPFIAKQVRKEVCLLFASYSVAALLLSAFAVLPLLSQWAASARTSVSFWQTLKTAPLQGNYETTLPVLLQSLALLPFFFFRKPKREDLPYFAVALFVFLPAVVEPFNVIWQTGTYMAFPIRYGFITNFMLLVPVARALTPRTNGFVCLPQKESICPKAENSTPKPALSSALVWGKRLLPVAAAFAAVIVLFQYSTATQNFLTEHKTDLSSFARKLWGSKQSLRLYAKYFWLTVTGATALFFLYKTRLLKPALFGAAMLLFSFTSGYYTATAFLSYGSAEKSFYDKAIAIQTKQDALSQNLNFYRVKQTRKNYYVNYTGAAGYGSFSTYTSLTSKNGMDLAKILGYESNWMEIGSHNGTIFTDALLCTRYITYYTTLGKDANGNYLYGYALKKTPYYLPLGIVTSTDLTQTKFLFRNSRTDYQQRLFESVFPQAGTLLVEYDHSYLQNVSVQEQGEETVFYPTAKEPQNLIVYEIDVEGKQTLYLDVFHNAAFQLSQPTFETLSVKVDGATVASTYPTGDDNGFLTLGTFENERVTVELVLKKTLRTTSFGVFGLKDDVLSTAVSSANSANLKAEGSRITGGVNASSGDYLFLSLPYEQGYTARVNGKKTPIIRTLDGFSAIALKEGSNEIEITYRPQGLSLGIFASLCGVGFLAILVAFSNKLRYNKNMGNIAYYAVTALSVLCVVAVYVIPMFVYYLT